MPVVIEKEGKTVSEATITACEELGVSRNDIEVEVLEEGSKGVLGIGGKNARVRITINAPDVTEKGLRSKKTLEELLDFFADSYQVELGETRDQIRLTVRCGEDKGLVIGKRGENLGAMEYIVGKIASKITENGREKRVYIDVDGYKRRREQILNKLIRNAARKAKRSGKPVPLESMLSHERKIAYSILRRIPGVRSETRIDDDDFKTIVVIPLRRGEQKRQREGQRGEGRDERGAGAGEGAREEPGAEPETEQVAAPMEGKSE